MLYYKGTKGKRPVNNTSISELVCDRLTTLALRVKELNEQGDYETAEFVLKIGQEFAEESQDCEFLTIDTSIL